MAGYEHAQSRPVRLRHMSRPAIREITDALDTTPVTTPGLAAWLALVLLAHAAFALQPLGLASIGLALASWGASAMVLALADFAALSRMSAGAPKRAVALGSYAAAGLTTAALTRGAAEQLGVAQPPVNGLYVVGAVIWLTSTAVLVNQQRRWAQALRALDDRRVELQVEQAAAAAALAETQADREAVISQVHRAVRAARYRISTISEPSEYLDVADGLAATVQFLVRPVSHSLARQSVTPEELGGGAPRSQTRRVPERVLPQIRRVLDDLGTTNPMRPVAVAVNTLPLAVAAVVGIWAGSGSAAATLAALLAGYAILAISAAAWQAHPPVNRLTRLHIALGTYAAMAVVYPVLAHLSHPQDQLTLLPALLPALFALFAGISATLEHRRQTALAEAAAIVAESQWAAAAVQQQLWASRRQLGIAMHGRVQAGLTAAALLLRGWVRAGADPDTQPETLARVEQTLRECLAAVDEPATPHLRELVADLVAVWDGVLNIELQLSPPALARLDGDPAAAAATGEILRELLLNAVHHGRANWARVRLAALGDNVVTLEVRTVQSGAAADAGRSGSKRSPGLGTELVASLSLRSDVLVAGENRTTTVQLAVMPPARYRPRSGR